MASSSLLQSNRLSCLTRRCALATVVGLTEVAAQYSRMCLEKSSVPISFALYVMVCLSDIHRGCNNIAQGSEDGSNKRTKVSRMSPVSGKIAQQCLFKALLLCILQSLCSIMVHNGCICYCHCPQIAGCSNGPDGIFIAAYLAQVAILPAPQSVLT